MPSTRFLLSILALFAALAAPSAAGGLHVALTTSEASIIIGDPASGSAAFSPRKKLDGAPARARSVTASVALTNRSGKDIEFVFPDTATAAYKWIFRLLNAEGTELWRSDSDVVGAQVLVPMTLKARQRWARTIQVPLEIDGVPLAPGQYSVAADLAAGSEIGARTLIKVLGAPDDEIRTGIRGKVTRDGKPVAGAMVRIHELRLSTARYSEPAFSWSGPTDRNGEFAVATPPGTFAVHARMVPWRPVPGIDPPLRPSPDGPKEKIAPEWEFPGSASTTVTVGEGEVVAVSLELGLPTKYPQGILGQVFVQPLNRTQQADDVAPEDPRPLAGAVVRIEEIREVDIMIYPPRPLFRWSGVADAEGKFTAPTPPGRFRVTASPPPPPPGMSEIMVYRPPAVAEVVVEPGVWTKATLWFNPSYSSGVTE
jgi:hypothetical protein